MSNPHNFQVGQSLYLVPNRGCGYRCSGVVSISKVGRKWATLDNDSKMDLQTLDIDGGGYSSPGKCYLSEQEYIEYKEKKDYWLRLRNKIPISPPACTLETLKQVAALLGLQP